MEEVTHTIVSFYCNVSGFMVHSTHWYKAASYSNIVSNMLFVEYGEEGAMNDPLVMHI